MKPSARRRIERQITELMKADGDRCSSCKTPFPDNSRTFGGITAGGDSALVGECCHRKLKDTILSGVYVDQRYKGLKFGQAGQGQQPRSAAQISEAVDAMQRTFQRMDQATDTVKVKGGVATKDARINTADSPWKDDDARWFKANQTRSHRLRPAFAGELEGLSNADGPIPAGHEYQMLAACRT